MTACEPRSGPSGGNSPRFPQPSVGSPVAREEGQFDYLIEATFGPLGPDASERTKQADADRHDVLWFLFHDADTQTGIRGTAWAGYQAVAEYVDHCAPVRAKSDGASARARRLLTSDEPTKTKRLAWSVLTTA